MTKATLPPFIAIDGGGTRCRLAYKTGGSIIAVETGPANVSSDFDHAVEQILEGLQKLAGRSGHALESLSDVPAFVGLAGMVSRDIADRLQDALPLENMAIEDDRPAALRGALGPDDGMIAHCGTGSFFGAQTGGQMRFAGGWGPVIGDEASAVAIGKAALRIVLDVVDGLAPTSPMAEHFLREHGGAPGIVAFAGSASQTALGDLAPTVTAHADKGDALARTVIQGGADHIAALLPRMGWQPGQPICLTGGLGPHYSPYLPPAMQAALTEKKGEPIEGALALAAHFAEECRA